MVTNRNARWIVALALPILFACGTFEVGIEPAATPMAALATTAARATEATQTAVPSERTSPTAMVPVPATPSPTSAVTPPSSRERITFASGATTYAFSTTLQRGVTRAYVLTIFAQQQLIIDTDGDVTIVILDSQNKTLVPVSARQGHWVGAIPQKGDYVILLSGEGKFEVTLNIPPLS